MNLLASIPFLSNKSKIPQQVISNSWSDREQILNKDVNLFCWERSLEPSIQHFLSEIIDRNPEPIQLSIHQTDLHHQIEKVRIKWDQYSKIKSISFWHDISLVVGGFLDFSENKSGTLHLMVVEDDACTKFHTDGYPLRLFTTYIGRGTEWLPEKAVNRAALGTTNDKIIKISDQIQHMNEGDVGILKGELPHKRSSSKGIIHRSPKISHTEEKRIILRVDL
ncbi:MAG: DUF1826 domain-containing protein [Bacteroidota bacterium]